MRSNKLTIRIIQRKKEVYYPLFTISISYLFYWIIILFISLANSQVVLPFLFWSISILIFIYSFDVYNASKKNNKPISKQLAICSIFISIIINSIAILRLVFLMLFDIYYVIPISIHFLILVMIYYILRIEVKKYYSNKNKQIIVFIHFYCSMRIENSSFKEAFLALNSMRNSRLPHED